MSKVLRPETAAMILAGGRGKRLDVLCHFRPKPLLSFAGNFRVIDFVLSNCLHSNLKTVAILADYQRAAMADYYKEWCSTNRGLKGLDILMPQGESYVGTADAVYQNLNYLHKCNAETVLVLAGDHIYKMDYLNMLSFHEKVKADVTVGVVPVPMEDAHRFGIVTTSAGGRIVEFVEKPMVPQSNLASMGIYVFNRETLCRRLREDAKRRDSLHDFGHSVIPEMVREDRVYAYPFSGYWQDIGTVESYYLANLELTRGMPGFSLDSEWPILTRHAHFSPPSITEPGSVRNSLISPGCLIKGEVENSVLSPGVIVGEKAVVKNSVIMENTRIGYHSVIDRCVMDEGVSIGGYCYIGFGSSPVAENGDITVLGVGVTVPPHTAISHNCRVLANVGAEDFTSRVIPSNSLVSKRAASLATTLPDRALEKVC